MCPYNFCVGFTATHTRVRARLSLAERSDLALSSEATSPAAPAASRRGGRLPPSLSAAAWLAAPAVLLLTSQQPVPPLLWAVAAVALVPERALAHNWPVRNPDPQGVGRDCGSGM